jgi:hypothetical protein
VKDGSQVWKDDDSDEEMSFKERKGPSFFRSREYSHELAASMIGEKKGSVLDLER